MVRLLRCVSLFCMVTKGQTALLGVKEGDRESGFALGLRPGRGNWASCAMAAQVNECDSWSRVAGVAFYFLCSVCRGTFIVSSFNILLVEFPPTCSFEYLVWVCFILHPLRFLVSSIICFIVLPVQFGFQIPCSIYRLFVLRPLDGISMIWQLWVSSGPLVTACR